MRKKGQAILPFFVVQLVCMMIFMIVLLTLLTMTKNVKYTINEFDERTAFLLAGRRLVSSADCFAYEERTVLYENDTGTIFSAARIFPNLIDYNKLLDYENFNCMRKDFYDKKVDVYQGYWDASNATGAVFSYMIKVVDLKTNESVYKYDASNNFSTSLVGRINKSEAAYILGAANAQECMSRGGRWTVNCKVSFPFSCSRIGSIWSLSAWCVAEDFKACARGRCWNTEQSSTHIQPDGARPYWIISDEVYNDLCYYTFDDTNVPDFTDDNSTAQTIGDLKDSGRTSAIWKQTRWDQFDTTCAGVNSTRSMVMPTMLKVGDEIHPAVMYIKTCLISGQNYTGRNMLEFQYTAPAGGTQCP